MAKILYCEPVTPALHELLEEYKPAGFDLCYWQMLNTEAREAALAEADYLMVAACKVTAAMLAKAAKLRFIQKNGAGYDNIDIEAARQQGIPVANTPGGNLSAVAELTIGLILALYRKLPLLDRTTKNGDWLMWDYRPFSFEMSGKVHGIIGFGNIGREVARLSRAFGTEILYYDVNRADPQAERSLGAVYTTLETLLKTADIVSLHLPLLPTTRGLLDAARIGLMKATAVLVNVSRGNIVDEDALYAALAGRRLLGAAVDVWSTEPVDRGNRLLTLDSVLATPHTGAGTREAFVAVLTKGFRNITQVENGVLPAAVVNQVSSLRAGIR